MNHHERPPVPFSEQACPRCLRPLHPQTGACAVHGKHVHELVPGRAGLVCRTCHALDANNREGPVIVVVLIVLGACLAFIAGIAVAIWRVHR